MSKNSTAVLGLARPKHAALLDIGSLYAEFMTLRDGRKRRGKRYALAVVLLLIVLAKLCGEDRPQGIAQWVQARKEVLLKGLGLARSQVPCLNTYRRVLSGAVEVSELTRMVARFLTRGPRAGKSRLICIDGKTLRGTIAAGQSQGVHLVAAYLPEERVVLMQVAVGAKENEIVAAPKILGGLDLRGKVVMGDAMFTQRELSSQVVEGGGEYIWYVKDNQPRMREDIETLFEPERCVKGFSPGVTDLRRARECGKEHGRIEHREICVSGAMKGYLEWPYLEQVFKLERDRVRSADGTVTAKVVYGVTSLTPTEAGPRRLLDMTRSYWGIENGLHYRRDKTLQEDATHMSNETFAEAMATLNNLVIGLVAQASWRHLPSARRHYCAHPKEALRLLLHSPG